MKHACLAFLAGCLPAPALPPTAGYGAPYHGTGEGIYVKDSRNDWAITEGHHRISSEQALEAAGDEEYEARRQIANAYNQRLYGEARAHRRLAYRLLAASAAAIVAGVVLNNASDSQSATGAANVLEIAGVLTATYAYLGGRRPPPYHHWHTPGPLDRPAYVRQQTEPYNERIGAPTLPDIETGTEPPRVDARLQPRPHIPRPRGGR